MPDIKTFFLENGAEKPVGGQEKFLMGSQTGNIIYYKSCGHQFSSPAAVFFVGHFFDLN